MNRYRNRQLVRNNLPQYKEKLAKRGKSFAIQYSTLSAVPLTMPQIASIEKVPYRWGHGDKFFKLAAEYYGDTSKWWIIAWYNELPTENHVNLGDLIYIPLYTDELLDLWGV